MLGLADVEDDPPEEIMVSDEKVKQASKATGGLSCINEAPSEDERAHESTQRRSVSNSEALDSDIISIAASLAFEDSITSQIVDLDDTPTKPPVKHFKEDCFMASESTPFRTDDSVLSMLQTVVTKKQ